MRATARADRGQVLFKNIGSNHSIPMQPWPQTFYVTRTMLYQDAVEVRPLTITGLLKGVGRNLITMSFWRLCRTLLILGFLATPEGECYGWRHLTWRCWEHHMLWRFRLAKKLMPERAAHWEADTLRRAREARDLAELVAACDRAGIHVELKP